jgi:hypothetical protein
MKAPLVPMHLRDLAKTHGIPSWAASKKCPEDFWFGKVDQARAYVQDLTLSTDGSVEAEDDPSGGDEPRWEVLVPVIAGALHFDQALSTLVLDNGQGGLANDDDWHRICVATAWCIVGRYARAVNKGSWPK